jgi:hypothetical protein
VWEAPRPRGKLPRPRGKLLVRVGGSSSVWEAPHPCGKLLVRVGGSSSVWEAPHPCGKLPRPRGRLLVREGSSSSVWEAPRPRGKLPRPRGKLLVREGSSSSAREAPRPRGRLFVRSGGSSSALGGSSSAPELPPTCRSFFPGVAASSHPPDVPRAHPRSDCRWREACSPREGPRWCRWAFLQRFASGPPDKVLRHDLWKYGRRDQATPEGLVDGPGSWPRAGCGGTSWRAKHPRCRRRSR